MEEKDWCRQSQSFGIKGCIDVDDVVIELQK